MIFLRQRSVIALLILAASPSILSVFSFSISANFLRRIPKTELRMLGKGFGKPKFTYAGSLQPGVISPKLEVPKGILLPDYAIDGKPKLKSKGGPTDIYPQTPEDLIKMRTAGKIAREVLDAAVRMVKPGITTHDIDVVVHQETIARNSYPCK